MTRRTTAGPAWNYVAGEKGRNRARVFERGSVIYLVYFADGQRVRQSLGHNDRERAKREADEIAARFGRDEQRPTSAMTLGRLLTTYEREVTPTKAKSTQGHDRRTFPLFLKAFGVARRPDAFTVRDWSAYIARRRSGEIAPERSSGKVRNRIIEQDLKLLLAVMNWGERARLIDRNPFRGFDVPKEEAPRRPVMPVELFATVRAKASESSPAAELFVCLLWFTGHRAASVRQLRWSDIGTDSIRWRAEVDKIGYEHVTPIHEDLAPVLENARAIAELTGEVVLFPAAGSLVEPMSRDQARKLWDLIASTAGIVRGSRMGPHSFRRAFANQLRNVPLREIKDLGGWKSAQTVVGTYLQPDQAAQREALKQL